jgi:outer membrane protein
MKRILLTGAFAIVITLIVVFLIRFFFIPQTAYVNINLLYNSFSLKDELEKKLTKTQKEREKILDSLEVELKVLSKKIQLENQKNAQDINAFLLKKENFSLKEQQFNEDGEAQAEEYKTQIWKRLKQYVNEYGKKKGYDFILGMDEGYTLLYSDEGKNITEEVKSYVNERYSGK